MIDKIKKISSLSNEEVKNIVRLKKPRERKKQNLILIEGRHEICLASEAGVEIRKLYYSPEFVSDDNFFIEVDESVVLEKEVFKSLSQRENPDGYLALARVKSLSLEMLRLSKNPLVIVLESLEKPGNIGAILRTADAAGVDAVIVCDSRTDIYNPNTIRSSLGTVFTNQLCVCSTDKALAWIKRNNFNLFSTTPDAKTLYNKIDMTLPTAIVVGAEHLGLSSLWKERSSELIKIPMQGRVDSLNASVSAAIVLFEAIRQRQEAQTS